MLKDNKLNASSGDYGRVFDRALQRMQCSVAQGPDNEVLVVDARSGAALDPYGSSFESVASTIEAALK